ncbi:TetR/AcrR family transcriptional regulator [Spirillospora sp. NPDC047279]|uniref:TetR/AcrR family transcriptional regulator n=1 Tax=Spirillospora sp. NPDC047279 TaxID=3155478 RepID=UPI003411B54E
MEPSGSDETGHPGTRSSGGHPTAGPGGGQRPRGGGDAATAPGAGGKGRRRQERRELTRAALLGAAEKLWAERGIHGASLDDVAAAAGLTKGAVYSNFAGKTDLLLALLERYTRERIGTEICDELRDAAKPLGERFEQAGRIYARRLGGDDARLLALLLVEFWLYGMRDYAAGWRLADWYAERREVIARRLSPADGVDTEQRAALAMAVDFGLAFQHLLDPEGVPAELYATGMRLVLADALDGGEAPGT